MKYENKIKPKICVLSEEDFSTQTKFNSSIFEKKLTHSEQIKHRTKKGKILKVHKKSINVVPDATNKQCF